MPREAVKSLVITTPSGREASQPLTYVSLCTAVRWLAEYAPAGSTWEVRDA